MGCFTFVLRPSVGVLWWVHILGWSKVKSSCYSLKWDKFLKADAWSRLPKLVAVRYLVKDNRLSCRELLGQYFLSWSGSFENWILFLGWMFSISLAMFHFLTFDCLLYLCFVASLLGLLIRVLRRMWHTFGIWQMINMHTFYVTQFCVYFQLYNWYYVSMWWFEHLDSDMEGSVTFDSTSLWFCICFVGGTVCRHASSFCSVFMYFPSCASICGFSSRALTSRLVVPRVPRK